MEDQPEIMCGICGETIPDTNKKDGNMIYGIKCPIAEHGFGICSECVEMLLPA